MEELRLRVAELEDENRALRDEVAALRAQLEKKASPRISPRVAERPLPAPQPASGAPVPTQAAVPLPNLPPAPRLRMAPPPASAPGPPTAASTDQGARQPTPPQRSRPPAAGQLLRTSGTVPSNPPVVPSPAPNTAPISRRVKQVGDEAPSLPDLPSPQFQVSPEPVQRRSPEQNRRPRPPPPASVPGVPSPPSSGNIPSLSERPQPSPVVVPIPSAILIGSTGSSAASSPLPAPTPMTAFASGTPNLGGSSGSITLELAKRGSVIVSPRANGTPSRSGSIASGEFAPLGSVGLLEEMAGWPCHPVDGRVISAFMLNVVDDAGVARALGFLKLKLSALGVYYQDDEKTEWFLVKAALQSETSSGEAVVSWVVPRSYAAFQLLATKSLVGCSVELPPKALFKSATDGNSTNRVAALNTWLWELSKAHPAWMQSSLAVLRFVDPYDKPSLLGLHMLVPLCEGQLEMWMGGTKASKARMCYGVVREDLWLFKLGPDALRISLEHITIDICNDYPGKFVFTITNLEKELWFFAVESTKGMSEWILRLREAKYARSSGPVSTAPPPAAKNGNPSSAANAAGAFAERQERIERQLTAAESTPMHPPPHRAPTASALVRSDEPDRLDNPLLAPDGSIREATPSKLFEKLCDCNATPPALVATFLLTFRYWLTPADLLAAIELSWEGTLPGEATETTPSHVRLLLVLRTWVSNHFESDFWPDPQLTERLLLFLRARVLAFPVFGLYSTVLLAVLRKHVERAVVSERNPPGSPAPLLPPIMSPLHIELLDLHPLEVARQLTLLEHRMYRAVQVTELQDQRWNSAAKEELCPNIMAIVRRFNQTSLWVQTLIVHTSNIKARAALIAHLLEVCHHLLELCSYNCVWEIFSGLKSSAVKRLTDTWEQVPEPAQRLWTVMSDFTDTTANFRSYRGRLADRAPDQPCVPYLGLYLTDLTFAEEKNPSPGGAARLTLAKYHAVGSVLADIARFKNPTYALRTVDYLTEYFTHRLDHQDEETNFAQSLLLQPRK